MRDSFVLKYFYGLKDKNPEDFSRTEPSGRPGRAGLRLAPRIIELYQIFPFIVNYGTIRMEL